MLRRRRPDDTSENIERRLRDYKEVGRVVEQWYGAQRIARINGTGAVTDVAKRVAEAVEGIREDIKLKTRSPVNEGLKQREPEP